MLDSLFHLVFEVGMESSEASANPATFTRGMDGEVAYAPIGANQFCFHCRDLKSVTFDLSTLLVFRTFG